MANDSQRLFVCLLVGFEKGPGHAKQAGGQLPHQQVQSNTLGSIKQVGELTARGKPKAWERD